MSGDQLPAAVVVVRPRARVAHVRPERLAVERALDPAIETGHAGAPGNNDPQVLLVDRRHDLPTGAVDVEVVLFGVEAAVGAGEEQALVEKCAQLGDVGGQLGGLKPSLGTTEQVFGVVRHDVRSFLVALVATPWCRTGCSRCYDSSRARRFSSDLAIN